MLQEEAVLDIQVAFEWYEEKREGLGDELLQEIEHCLKEIEEHPHHYSFVNISIEEKKPGAFRT